MILEKVVNLILGSNHRIEDNTLFCDGLEINTLEIIDVIDYLIEKNVLENSLETYKLNQIVDLELTMARLMSIDFYPDFLSFIKRNRYVEVKQPFFIYSELKKGDELIEFCDRYETLIKFINSIKFISEHNYTEVDITKSIIISEQKSIILELDYSFQSVNDLNIKMINTLTNVFVSEDDHKKKLLFINELIEFTQHLPMIDRFNQLLYEIDKLISKCNNVYQFYLSDFSSHKLKLELDSKALEFSQKVQAVINDSQTKLIAIPTAFILVFTIFDFVDLYSMKNVVAVISVFIFSLLLQIFLNNQKSALKFIENNIAYYKSLFVEKEIKTVTETFQSVESELLIQKNRLFLIEVILWAIPIFVLCLWFYLIQFQMLSIVLIITYILLVILLFLFNLK